MSSLSIMVSIRSRRLSAGEDEVRRTVVCLVEMFQSAPADCRREKTAVRRAIQTPLTFQSAPADCRREKASDLSTAQLKSVFQSAPADCRREKAVRRPHAHRSRGFNPLPPTVGGRRLYQECERLQELVSIRSRRLSAGEDGPRPRFSPTRRFNPLPPTVGGRSRPQRRADVHGHVSIRSRRLSAGEEAGTDVKVAVTWFQSAPADCRREKPPAPAVMVKTPPFQSAPADCRREKLPDFVEALGDHRFNPLPPTVGGRRA